MWRFPGIRSTACSLLFFCLPGTENRMFFAAADVVKVLKYKLPMWWRCSTTSFRRGEGAQLQASCRYGWYFCGLRSVRQKKKKAELCNVSLADLTAICTIAISVPLDKLGSNRKVGQDLRDCGSSVMTLAVSYGSLPLHLTIFTPSQLP